MSTRAVSRSITTTLAPVVLTAASMGACDKSSASEKASEPGSSEQGVRTSGSDEAAGAKAAGSAQQAAKPSGASQNQPKAKEYDAPGGDSLGQLPDDIGVPAGKQAPDFTVQNADGQKVTLSGLVSDGPVLLVFYRGGWCPYCNFQIRSLTQAHDAMKQRGVTPVAISVDQVKEAARTRATYDVPFPTLSDPDLNAHRAFNVIHEAGEEEVEKLRGFGLDIEEYSGREHHSYAVPSMFLIDDSRTVVWAHADPDYKVRPKTEQLLAVLEEHGFEAE